MKHYAIATDVIRNEPFGLVVKEGIHNVCHGFHEAGCEWANLYNTGAIKTLHDGLPPGVELGDFGPLAFDAEDLLSKSPQDIPAPKTFRLVDSQWLENDSLGLAIKDVGLHTMPQESRQLAIDYKAHAFLVESSRSSTLLAVRLGNGGLTPDSTGFCSKTADRHEFSHLALGDSHTRRIAKDVLNNKMLILSQPYNLSDIPETEIDTKALGAKLGSNLARGGRRARRAAQMFDPNARDADMDLLVQEGTPWERPAMPGKPDLPDLPRTARRRAAERTPEARSTAASATRDRRGLRAARPDQDGLSAAQERLTTRLREDTLDTTLGDLYSDPSTPSSVINAIENFTGLDKNDGDPIWGQKLNDISDTSSANILNLMETDVRSDPEKYFGQKYSRGLASKVTDTSNSYGVGKKEKMPDVSQIGPVFKKRLNLLKANGFFIEKEQSKNTYKITPPDRIRNAHRLQALRGQKGSDSDGLSAALSEIAAKHGVRADQLDVGNDAHWKDLQQFADRAFLSEGQTSGVNSRSGMTFHPTSSQKNLDKNTRNWLRQIIGMDPDNTDSRHGDDLLLSNLEDVARNGTGPLGYIPSESKRTAPKGPDGEKIWPVATGLMGGSDRQRLDRDAAARQMEITRVTGDIAAAEEMWQEAVRAAGSRPTPQNAAAEALASRLLQDEKNKLIDLEAQWKDPRKGPKSSSNFDARWNQAREESDNNIAELLDSVSEELGQAEPNIDNIQITHTEMLDQIESARRTGLRSVLRDGPDDYTPDPDLWHDDPFERDRAINNSIFSDRMDGMSIDDAAEKYGVNRHEVRSREIEHMEELSGQERYNAQPNLNQRIFDDRMAGLSLEDTAKKYDVDRVEVRAREITHSNALGGQERYNAQPNLNQRIYRDRMQGQGLDEVGRRYAMGRDEVRAREITHMGSDGRGLRSEGPKPEADAAKPEVDAAKTAELNRRIDTLRKSKLQPWVDRIAEAEERGDNKATHSLKTELRGFQEEEAELREQLGEAMGKGRVAIGLRSQRATEDWDADWATAREESITEMTELGQQLAGELKKSKTDKKKLDDLTGKISGSIEKARERGLASKGPGKPWQRPEPDSTNSFGIDGPPKDWALRDRISALHSDWEMYPPSERGEWRPQSRHWGGDDVDVYGRLRTDNIDAEIIRGENTGEEGFVIVGMFRDPDSATNAAEYFDSGVSSFRSTTEAQKWLDKFEKRLASDLDPWGDDEIPDPEPRGGLRSQSQIVSSTGPNGPKLAPRATRDWSTDHELVPDRFHENGHWVESADGILFKPYDKETKKELEQLKKRRLWLRRSKGTNDDIDRELEEIDQRIADIGSKKMMRQDQGRRGLASRSDSYYQPDDDPEFEKEFERQWERFRKEMQNYTLDQLVDELPSDGWRKLDEFQATLDEDELDAQLDKPIKDLPEAWQKAIRDLSEAAFNDDPDALMEMDGLRRGPGPPDPYDVQQERRMGGLRSRTRTATTERAATRRGLASRKKTDERSISELYGGDSPRQPGSTDGKIWDALSADGGMTSDRTQAITDAATELEAELLWTPGGGAQSTSLTGTAIDKAGTTWGWAMKPAIAQLMFGDEKRVDDVPSPEEWRLGEMSGDIDTDIAAIEDILQNQVVRMGAGSEVTVAHKRKLLDSLAVLAHMRQSGNYEALEQLHPKHRARLLGKARDLDQTIPEKIKPGAAKSTVFGAVGGFDSVEAFKNEMKGRTRSRSKRTSGSKRGTRRERVGEEAQRLTGSIRGQGGPAAWWKRRQAQARRTAAGRGGRPERAKVVKDPWSKDLPREEKRELKQAKKAAKKLGRLTPEKRLGRIRDKRSRAAMSQRDVNTPIGGAGATTAFAGTTDDLAQWEAAEGRPVVDASFIERLSFLTKIKRGEENAELKRNKGEGGGRKTSGERRIRDEVLSNASLTAGHNDLPELVDADELAELAFEADPDNPGMFRLREGFKPVQRGMGRGKAGKEGEAYWEQWTRLIGRFIPGQGGEGHKAGENHAEPPVLVDGVEAAKGNLYGGYGKGALSFVTPETKLIGWHKLAEINDEGDSITQVLRGAGLTDTEAPTSIKNDGDNFAAAVRAALDAAQTRGGGRLKVRNRNKDREPQDPNNPSRSLSTGSGFDISTRTSGTHDMGADWRETEFGAMVDQVLDLHDSGDIDDPTQLEEAWSFLVGMSESVGDNDTYLFDTLPIFGYDAVQRHGGVISISNRAAVVTLDHPVSGSEATAIIERLAKQGQLDQARLRELIPEYGDFR